MTEETENTPAAAPEDATPAAATAPEAGSAPEAAAAADDVTVVSSVIADDKGVLAEGAVAV